MTTLRRATLGKAWLDACRHVLRNGRRLRDGDEAMREALHLGLFVSRPDPADPVIAALARPEMLAWMERNFDAATLVPELGNAPSYGARLRALQGRDQIAWVSARLREKPESKSATVTTLLGTDEAYVPCVSLLDFKVRSRSLLVTCSCRSIDAGTKLPANLVCAARLQREVAAAVGVPAGSLVFWIVSAHVYDRDLAEVRGLLRRASAAGRRRSKS